MGLASSFDGESGIVLVEGDLESLLDMESIETLILDVSQETGWMESLLRVRLRRPALRIVVVGPADNVELMLRSITAGARAYLDPHSGPEAFRKAVETVNLGFIWAPRRVLSILVDRLLSVAMVAPVRAEIAFSPREKQVLDLITQGYSNRQIAEELGIEERTVKAYVASLFRKVGVENRVSLSVQTIQESKRVRAER